MLEHLNYCTSVSKIACKGILEWSLYVCMPKQEKAWKGPKNANTLVWGKKSRFR